MGDIFVFGSNERGIHGAGAALYARKRWGAQLGCGVGLTGRAYALPTKSDPYTRLSLEQVGVHVRGFLGCARSMPDRRFLLTKVGCGLAGFSEQDIAALFVDAPANVISVDDAGTPVGPANERLARLSKR